MSIHTGIGTRARLCIAALSCACFAAVPAATAQPARPPDPQAARIEQLMGELAAMQAEMAKLKRRVVELEKENADLKASGATLPGSKPGDKTKPGTPARDPAKYAPLPDEPLAGPDAALALFAADYASKVKVGPIDTPADRQKLLTEVGAWARAAKKSRGRVEWTIEVKEVIPDALKGGGSVRFAIVNAVDKRPYSDLILTQPISHGQMRTVTDNPDQKHWKLVGVFSADAKVNKDLESPETTPMFIGVFAEMSTTLTVQTLTPIGG